MNSGKRLLVYARQRGQDPFGQVNFTSNQSRRYTKKWRREFDCRRSSFGPLLPPDGRDLGGQGIETSRLDNIEKVKVTGEWV